MIYHNYEWPHSILTVWQQKNWGDSWCVSIVYKDMTYAKQIQRIAESHCASDGMPSAGYAWGSARMSWDVAERMMSDIQRELGLGAAQMIELDQAIADLMIAGG